MTTYIAYNNYWKTNIIIHLKNSQIVAILIAYYYTQDLCRLNNVGWEIASPIYIRYNKKIIVIAHIFYIGKIVLYLPKK